MEPVKLKRLFSETPLKQKSWSSFALIFVVIALFMECYASRGFPRYTFKRYLAFPKQAEHLDLYKAKFTESSLQIWP